MEKKKIINKDKHMYRVLPKLRTAEPFVYRIQGKYYYLGMGIFRECSSAEVKRYLLLLDQYSILKNCIRKLEKQDYKQFHPLFDAVISGDVSRISEEQGDIESKQAELLSKMDEEELTDLLNQFKIREEMYCYRCERPNRIKKFQG